MSQRSIDQRQKILVQHNRIALPEPHGTAAGRPALVTVLGNFVHYGYALSELGYSRLARASEEQLGYWWPRIEGVLKAITGDDKNMADFVVYKNFPAEVLAMSEADYWFRQILMYWGLPDQLFTEEAEEREAMKETPDLRVLHPAEDDTLATIRASMLRLPVRWTEDQWRDVQFLVTEDPQPVQLGELRFKENMVKLASLLFENGSPVEVASATDVLRLAAGLSDGDVSLRTLTRLRSFKRKERRFLLGLLEGAGHLEADVASRPGRFKRLFRALRPGDHADRFPRVCAAYDQVYRGATRPTFASELERLLAAGDARALDRLQTRPGEFARRLHSCLLRFGSDAIVAFARVLPGLTTIQLVKLHKYLETANLRRYRTFAPRGNWTRLQVVEVGASRELPQALVDDLLTRLSDEIRQRIARVVPAVKLDPAVDRVKLQTSDSDLTPYGRGTAFPIPDNIRFVRTASYWESGPTSANIWYDNGWNFFDRAWKSLGVCCWNAAQLGDAAVFSGDPTNVKDLKGRACQLIDLYLDKLAAAGVRFALWSLLCYSRKSFDFANEVHAALQWGEEAQTGGLFEPSRCQMSFPVRGSNFTKYIAYLDLERRELVYADANLYGRVSSAQDNMQRLSRVMPAFVDYLDTQPSVHDLFKHQLQRDDGLPVLYSDRDHLLHDATAYVFRPENKGNTFTPFSLGEVI